MKEKLNDILANPAIEQINNQLLDFNNLQIALYVSTCIGFFAESTNLSDKDYEKLIPCQLGMTKLIANLNQEQYEANLQIQEKLIK